MSDQWRLAPDEQLGRRVTDRKLARKLRRCNPTPMQVFFRECEDDLSVDRLRNDYLPDVSTVAASEQKKYNSHFFGWACVSQERASRKGRRVGPTCQPDNKYHVSIYWPPEVISDKKKLEEHATELAANSYWQEPIFPN